MGVFHVFKIVQVVPNRAKHHISSKKQSCLCKIIIILNDNLKLVSAIFYQIFVFPPNDSPSKTMKTVFYFIKKALFILKIFRLL